MPTTQSEECKKHMLYEQKSDIYTFFVIQDHTNELPMVT